MKIIELTGTCTAGGAATLTSTTKVTGRVEKVVMDYDDGATGADLTFTIEGVISQPLVTITNAGVADLAWYPRGLGVALAGTAYTDVVVPYYLADETIQCVVAQGGVSKNFRFLIYVSDE